MNRIIKSFVILFTLFLNLNLVSAEETVGTTTCEYSDLGLVVKFDESGTGNITQTKYEEHQTIPVLNWFVSNTSGQVSIVNELKNIEKELYGTCPNKIYACTLERKEYVNLGAEKIWDEDSALIYSNQKKVFLFYSESNMYDNSELKNLPNKEEYKSSFVIDNFNVGYDGCGGGVLGTICGIGTEVGLDIWDASVGSLEVYYTAYKSCDYVDYTGSLLTYNLACPNLNTYLKRFNESIESYKNCSKTDGVCISKTITDVNEKEDSIKKYCRSILQEQDYDGGTEQSCLESCMNIGAQTIKAKQNAGILSENGGDCGLSHRLIVWITNIFRWVKYILPVVVIILGILDFIKAIGADKDDELKKAQGRFIRRLIAAALVFIIPLILEFLLTKMGFGYDSCSLF